MTLERAPWAVRRALGHFGAYREGVGQLVGRLRDTFDPGQCLSVALEGVGVRAVGRSSGGQASASPIASQRSTAPTARPLDPCVHCGFCLPACPTYLATGDEADSPRGRIVLMRALERGEIGADGRRAGAAPRRLPGLPGMRAGVPVGRGTTAGAGGGAGAALRERGLPPLGAHGAGRLPAPALWRPLFTLARAVPGDRAPRALAGGGRLGFGMGMLAAYGGGQYRSGARRIFSPSIGPRRGATDPLRLRPRPLPRPTVALFRGCVMDTLFRHVHDATAQHARGQRLPGGRGRRARPAAGRCTSTPATAHAARRARPPERRAPSADDGRLRRGQQRRLRRAAQGLRPSARRRGRRRGLAAKVRDVSELLAARGPAAGRPSRAGRGLRRALPPAARPAGARGAARRAPRDPRPPAPAAARL